MTNELEDLRSQNEDLVARQKAQTPMNMFSSAVKTNILNSDLTSIADKNSSYDSEKQKHIESGQFGLINSSMIEELPQSDLIKKIYSGKIDMNTIDDRGTFSDKYRLFFFQVLEYMRTDCKQLARTAVSPQQTQFDFELEYRVILTGNHNTNDKV